MVERPVDASTARRADHQRAAEVSVRPVAHASGLADDLIERRMDEVGELDLGDRKEFADSFTVLGKDGERMDALEYQGPIVQVDESVPIEKGA
jgi:hypothetical protein